MLRRLIISQKYNLIGGKNPNFAEPEYLLELLYSKGIDESKLIINKNLQD